MILAQGTVCRSDTAIQAQPSPMDISSPSCARGSQQDRRRCTLPCTTRTDRSALSKTLPAWPTLPRREGMNFEGQAGCTGGRKRSFSEKALKYAEAHLPKLYRTSTSAPCCMQRCEPPRVRQPPAERTRPDPSRLLAQLGPLRSFIWDKPLPGKIR